MIETATGLVMRTRPLTETSLIVHWLAKDVGRVATVAKGARRSGSPFRGKLDLFYEASFSFQRSRRSELHTLREVDLQTTHEFLRHELVYFQQAAYCSALIEISTESEASMNNIFDLMRSFLKQLPQRPPAPESVFAFELKLLDELGLKPDLGQTRQSEGIKEIIRSLLSHDWPFIGRLKLSDGQRLELGRFLQGFLVFHLGKIPRNRAAAWLINP